MTDTLLEQQANFATGKEIHCTVQTGDNLAKIAQVYYGSEEYWSKIHQANLDLIGGNPHEIQVGLVLNIPA